MTLRPDVQQFINDQVRTGRFTSAEAVIEAAISVLRDQAEDTLDDASVAAINRAEEQADRGEGMELDAFRQHIRQRYVTK